ncbi:hypothetical protein [Spiroplasma turonicum]|uniref:Aldose 1-epimerase family protein n=1 Tax=Spiroplasma turonicum TaxID=216946 RepID=A0A0K1P5J9_9MOLU|nr:hypothetical protein [Spiroplasma turonicum]AKU79454.1 aldose 1-epimerase family protein [Spiroplasma turonicum]ALX70476.1 aldose 1-epimerase [Spiroplasma turonicum]
MFLLKNKEIEAKIVIDKQGLEVVSLKHNGIEVLYQQDGSWGKTWPILYPICGSVNGPYLHNGRDYHTPRHGFFSQIKDWTIDSQTNEKIVCHFKNHYQFQDIYPFEFEITITILLDNNKFIYLFDVMNIGKELMSYSFGHHPAFKVEKDSKVIFSNEQFYSSKAGKGNTYVPDHNKIAAKEIVISEVDFSDSKSLLFDQFNLDSITYLYKDKTINMYFDKNPYFVIWKATNDMDFVCLEPYWGLPDLETRLGNRYRDKLGMKQLECGESEVLTMTLEIN